MERYEYSDYTLYEHQFCYPSDECLQFEMKDSYGDGIFLPYGYNFTVDDVLLATSLDGLGLGESVMFGNGCDISPMPSAFPTMTPTDVIPCPEEKRNGKFWGHDLMLPLH